MIIIDYKDTRPIYEQIVGRFELLILRGVLQTDEQMPSVRTLAMELSINPNTIQRAYTELERQGFIYSVKGRGSFVAYSDKLLEGKRAELRDRVDSVRKEAEELGFCFQELIKDV
jgi:GntR family transcriptional regulator